MFWGIQWSVLGVVMYLVRMLFSEDTWTSTLTSAFAGVAALIACRVLMIRSGRFERFFPDE